MALSFGATGAQQLNLDLGHHHNLQLEESVHAYSSWNLMHTGMKPYVMVYTDSIDFTWTRYGKGTIFLMGPEDDQFRAEYGSHRVESGSWFGRKFLHENLVIVEDVEDGFSLTADPLFHFQVGKDLESDSSGVLYQNTRGFRVAGSIGTKLSFATYFYENQALFPEYITGMVNYTGVVPGNGRVKPLSNGGFDYSMASGHVSYSPVNQLNIQFGHGKHFIGDGYRSLLLSDNAFNYPYLKFTTRFFGGKLQYTNLFTLFQSQERFEAASTPEALFKRKGGSFHHLSVNIGSRIQLGLFEGTIYKRVDSLGTLPVDYAAFIPVLGIGTAMNGFDGENNVVFGLTGKVKLWRQVLLYGQLMIDDPSDKKIGIQAGFHAHDPFNVEGLHVQGELNLVNEYSYMASHPMHGYVHYNQSLAHPMGAGFTEIVGILDYEYKRFFTRAKVNIAQYQDTWGQDVLLSDTLVNVAVVPNSVQTTMIDLKLGYRLMKRSDMNIYFGIVMRDLNAIVGEHKTMWFQFGFRTWLNNQYLDF